MKLEITLIKAQPFAAVLTVLSVALAAAQTAPVTGLHNITPSVAALTGVRLHQAPGRVVENAVVVVREGRIEAAGAEAKVPADAVVHDLAGRDVYPAFIDLCAEYGVKTAERPDRGAGYWNPSVLPELSAAKLFEPDHDAASSWRRGGFAAVLTFPGRGVFRGSGALVLLADTTAGEALLGEDMAQAVAFSKGPGFPGGGVEGYPGSLMGHVALIRQGLHDARWYAGAMSVAARDGQEARPEQNISLEALGGVVNGSIPPAFLASHELDPLRASSLMTEFGLEGWVVGTGHEYRRAEAMKQAGLRLVLPVDFPEAPDVSSPVAEADVSLRELKHWDLAPENPARLHSAGVRFTLTARGLDKPEKFLGALRKAVAKGLPREAAMAALTTTPASWLGKQGLLGTVEPGKLANLLVTDGDIFDNSARVLETWVAGSRYELVDTTAALAAGKWRISASGGGVSAVLEVREKAGRLSGEVEVQGTGVKLTEASFETGYLNLVMPGDSLGIAGMVRIRARIEGDRMTGRAVLPDGERMSFSGSRTAGPGETDSTGAGGKKDGEPVTALFEPVFPEGALGLEAQPEQPPVLAVTGATIWTCGPEGVLEDAVLLVREGRIAAVGTGIEVPAGAKVIDAAGRHVTPGLIDAHSHIAIEGGVNENTHPVTSEVRIRDALDPDDINIYRQLAGGITAALTIHGSANPIGGQASLLKLRWGELPERMLVRGAKPVIKFALGENVTQAWNRRPNRYPASRMGVDQILRDWFGAAMDYRAALEEHERRGGVPPRPDLRLDALLDVLNGGMWVHCHSYRQDEILATLRAAEDIGFRIRVLVHVLEGYKVAEAIRSHGALPTTFSDWWAYKFEVWDAIPYNGALMHEQELTVSFNSDDAELARRMNVEAAKAVKYGGVPRGKALEFVTLNPAIQLGIDDRTGSLEPGKDADFVIWSGDPLSVYTMCEQTWIDGRCYFDRAEDRRLRDRDSRQREALVQRVLREKGGAK